MPLGCSSQITWFKMPGLKLLPVWPCLWALATLPGIDDSNTGPLAAAVTLQLPVALEGAQDQQLSLRLPLLLVALERAQDQQPSLHLPLHPEQPAQIHTGTSIFKSNVLLPTHSFNDFVCTDSFCVISTIDMC